MFHPAWRVKTEFEPCKMRNDLHELNNYFLAYFFCFFFSPDSHITIRATTFGEENVKQLELKIISRLNIKTWEMWERKGKRMGGDSIEIKAIFLKEWSVKNHSPKRSFFLQFLFFYFQQHYSISTFQTYTEWRSTQDI